MRVAFLESVNHAELSLTPEPRPKSLTVAVNVMLVEAAPSVATNNVFKKALLSVVMVATHVTAPLASAEQAGFLDLSFNTVMFTATALPSFWYEADKVTASLSLSGLVESGSATVTSLYL